MTLVLDTEGELEKNNGKFLPSAVLYQDSGGEETHLKGTMPLHSSLSLWRISGLQS